MTVVLKVKNGELHSIYNVVSIRRSKRKNCDFYAIDTFNHDFHFSSIQLICIRG